MAIKNIWNYFERIKPICKKNNANEYLYGSNSEQLFLLLHVFYHYFNANEDDFEAAISGINYCRDWRNVVDALFIDNFDESEIIDVLHVSFTNDGDFDLDLVVDTFKRMQEIILNINRKKYPSDVKIFNRREEIFQESETGKNLNNYCFKFITNQTPTDEEKQVYNDEVEKILPILVGKYSVTFRIVYGDDILSEIDDIETPKECVEKGLLILKQNNGVLFYGEEKSFLTTISALSLKEIYKKFSKQGLFAMNLRYYVKSVKIDDPIRETIESRGDRFWYYNNGLIIVCDDYEIKGNELILYNFSIVNGAQTTTLIGSTPFEYDFFITCKVIKTKLQETTLKTEFISAIAEASNAQKQIKAKDLIANRIEQRLLKSQMAGAGVFVQVKRGDKINKQVYKESWQNTTNSEIAQLLYSMVYLHPGIARNNVSKMLNDQSTYDLIFKIEYDTDFLVDMMHIRTFFKSWAKKVNKSIPIDENKIPLIKNGMMFMLGIFGVVLKFYYNEKLHPLLRLCEEEAERTRFLLMQPDINHRFIRSINEWTEKQFFELFDIFYMQYFGPAYAAKKGEDYKNDYSNFTKTDINFSNYVYPRIYRDFLNGTPQSLKRILDTVLYELTTEEKNKVSKYFVTEYNPGFEKELKDFRSSKAKAQKIRISDVITDREIAYIILYKPTEAIDLYKIQGFSEKKVTKFGENIIEIVNKYREKLPICKD
jgi:hypothetical protein